MIAALLATALQLQLAQEVPGPALSGGMETPSAEVQTAPLHTTAWVMAGGYGMASLGAGIGGIMASAFSHSGGAKAGDLRDPHAGDKAMIIGAVIGLIPGLLFGNEARKDESSIARSVILLTGAGGTLAIGFGWAQSH